MKANEATASATGRATGLDALHTAAARAALADLAFGSLDRSALSHVAQDGSARHLALLPADALELDLADPAQRRLGDYELIELIGEGGMGVVYRARQASLERDVAVKLLSAGPWASREFIERFRREAQNAARMQHPNIVTVFEVGTVEELHFFSMALVRGESLAARLRRGGPLPPREAARLLRIVAQAVAYAHSLGVLHLDLKPANVLLDQAGVPHVADFGLARRLDHALTLDNTEISGTPSYMAPEQASLRQQTLSTGTDIWGLGAILHEMVTGQPPFRGNDARATLRLVRDGELTRPRSLQPGLSRDLEAVILACLARDPAHRYAGAGDLADDLARYLEGRPVSVRPLSAWGRAGRWARREPRLAASALLALGALLAGLLATTQQWRRAEANADVSNERLWQSRNELALRAHADGRGFEALAPLLANIGEQEAGGRDAGRERRQVGLILGQGTTLIDRMTVADAQPIAAALSPDGGLLAIGLDNLGVRWYDTATLAERGRVDLSGFTASDGGLRVPQLLRFVDGHRLRVTLEWFRFLPDPQEGESLLVDLDRAQVVAPPAMAGEVIEAVYSADGRHALLRDRRGDVRLWQVEPWRRLSDALVTGASSSRRDANPRDSWLLAGDGTTAVHIVANDVGVHRPGARAGVGATPLVLPPHGNLSAWGQDRAGNLLAFGDDKGRVFVAALAGDRVRVLPSPLGGRVTWLAFSEDGLWLAAGRADGSAIVFDIDSGEAIHGGLLQLDFEPAFATLSRRGRLLLVAGTGDSALWRLPEEGPGAREATRLPAGPTRATRAGRYWMGAALPAGLLASADMDGEVRLWRLPAAPALAAGPPLQSSDRLHFDGRRIVDVAWNRLRTSAPDGSHATAWRELPQAIGFAELVDASRTLLATSGTTLHVLDAATLEPRRTPIALPATPLRFAASADGRLLVLSFPHNASTGFQERIAAIDVASGRTRARATLAGPLRQLQLSPGDSRLLATGPADGSTSVLDSATLQPLGTYAHRPGHPVLWAAFGESGELWLVARDSDDARSEEAELVRFDPRAGAVRERRRMMGVQAVGIAIAGGKPVLVTRDRLVLDPGTPGERRSAPLRSEDATALVAVSRDGRLLAHASGRDVYLYDAATLQPLGPPLHTGGQTVDQVVQLAFASDDGSLLARSLSSPHWFRWRLASDRRSLAELERDSAPLLAHEHAPRVLRLAAPGERARLRRQDPGPPPDDVRPPLASVRAIDGHPVPARDAVAGALQLDLAAAYNHAPGSRFSVLDSVMPGLGAIPFGTVRIEGIDYDLRGALELHQGGAGSRGGGVHGLKAPAAVRGIALPATGVAALHVLVFAPLPLPAPAEEVYATVRLQYRDGSTEVLPLRTQREVPGWTAFDRPVPVGWVQGDHLRQSGQLRQLLISNPRLANPHPERPLQSLDLEAAAADWSTPVFLAITIEPVTTSAPSAPLPTRDAGIPEAGSAPRSPTAPTARRTP